jgi:anti-sigma factor RsiW
MKDRERDLQRYLDGEMEAEERARFEASLGAEERAQLAMLGMTGQAVRNALVAEAAGVDLWPAIEAKLGVRPVRRSSRWRRFGLSSGLLAVAAAAGFFLLMQPGHPSNNCDVESLEVDGSLATVMTLHDNHRHIVGKESDHTMTVIWHEEPTAVGEED